MLGFFTKRFRARKKQDIFRKICLASHPLFFDLIKSSLIVSFESSTNFVGIYLVISCTHCLINYKVTFSFTRYIRFKQTLEGCTLCKIQTFSIALKPSECRLKIGKFASPLTYSSKNGNNFASLQFQIKILIKDTLELCIDTRCLPIQNMCYKHVKSI